MPCNSDYLRASGDEMEMSEVVALLDELDGKPIPPNYGDGYDARVYNRLSKVDCDALVAGLCTLLSKVDVKKYSLEMQIWWRNHQKADAKRKNREAASQIRKDRAEAALKKLNSEEMEALGISKHITKKGWST